MANTLNFNKIKKQYMTVTLADKDETTIMIAPPTKKMMDDLIVLQENLQKLEDNEDETTEATEDLYSACARIMSRNKGGIEITTEFLSDIFDFEDIFIFFNAYMEFITEVTNQKN